MLTQRLKMTWQLTALLLITSFLAGCGVNNIPRYDEQVVAAWSQVENQYQRRADLVPNLVETVKGFAQQERETLTAVVEARSRATSIQISADDLDDPEAMRRFEEAQNQLTGALSRLMAISENYPQLTSNQNFLALQSQLEGTENRIAVARRDYITQFSATTPSCAPSPVVSGRVCSIATWSRGSISRRPPKTPIRRHKCSSNEGYGTSGGPSAMGLRRSRSGGGRAPVAIPDRPGR